MDPFTHTFVGLAAAKAGLERVSPLATTVCMLAANSPDSDVVVGFVSDRWNYLHHHRGITHSIVGVLTLAVIVPSIVWIAERGFARLRGTKARTKFRGLLIASLSVTPTHPLMDWTNNYGVRPFLPWSGQWYYGDLVFVVDPFILLVAAGAGFLATEGTRRKMVRWAAVASGFIIASLIVGGRSDQAISGVTIARVVLVVGVIGLILVRVLKLSRGRERIIAGAALAAIVIYWIALSFVHRAVYNKAIQTAAQAVAPLNERVGKLAVMPTLANPLRWSCVYETDRAIYRFIVTPGDASQIPTVVDGYHTDSPEAIERFEKPTGRAGEIASVAAEDRRAKILLNFARFPIARVQDESCITRTIVQIADLRYTEPGTSRGTFSLNVPVECTSK